MNGGKKRSESKRRGKGEWERERGDQREEDWEEEEIERGGGK